MVSRYKLARCPAKSLPETRERKAEHRSDFRKTDDVDVDVASDKGRILWKFRHGEGTYTVDDHRHSAEVTWVDPPKDT